MGPLGYERRCAPRPNPRRVIRWPVRLLRLPEAPSEAGTDPEVRRQTRLERGRSEAGVWLFCPGAADATDRRPRPDHPDARHGIAAVSGTRRTRVHIEPEGV